MAFPEIPSLIMEMDSLNVQEVEKVQKTDPDLSAMKQNATRASALDTILKSLWKISVFRKELLESFTEDEYVTQLRDFILKITNPMESNGVHDFFVTILELLPRWKSGYEEQDSLKSKFQLYETATKICNRCNMDIDYPLERAYGVIVIANSLREIKSAFKDLAFENILKLERTALMMMPCDKEGCEKRNYVERVITTLPSVFTIALEWENNETEQEILATTSVLATEIDIREVYKYQGDSTFTKYCLVSMVCLCGDQYNCIAYENSRWIRYFGSKKEAIGDWDSVLSCFVKLNIRPEILFFEKVMGTNQIVFGSLG